MKLSKFKNARIFILIFFLLFSLYIIDPKLSAEGVVIKSVELNSSIARAGLTIQDDINPRDREIILSINNQEIKSLEDYSQAVLNLNTEVIRVRTDRTEYAFLNKGDLGITVEQAARSNIRKGLDLQGGTRVLLQPVEEIEDSQYQDLMNILENRLNVYGLSDIKVREAKDLFQNRFIVLEIAGVSKEEVKELIASQGKFEAKIGEDVVFTGGERDILFVCRGDGTCSGVRQCQQATSQQYQCVFEFSIRLSTDAAQKHAEITDKLPLNSTVIGESYLSKPLDLFLDDILVDSLQIGASLKGRATTDISISGPGLGATEEEALEDALNSMNKLQTALITGSLPTKLNVIKSDSISPVLGQTFLDNAIKTALLAIAAVGIVVYIRYRKLKIAIPMMIVGASEIFIILGISALMKYNLDLAAIAGIIAAVGTGVDDQIVITDEVLSGSTYNWKEKTKRAFFVIMAAYVTTVAALIPLFWAGAGLLTGFAIATIIGVSIGVFITRPAFAAILKALLGGED